jgi:NAD(P)H-flavin reductase
MSFTILGNRKLSENVFQMDVEAPLVARSRKAGQFVIVSVDEDSGERIPLTISGADPKKGSIRLIYQRVGKATSQMAY